MKQVKVTIKTLAPVVLSAAGNSSVLTATNDYISGNTIRGIVAAKYVGNKKDAHLQEEFRNYFFDKLRFVTAYPMEDYKGVPAIPLPVSLQKHKLDNSVLDLTDSKPLPNYKSIKGIGVIKGTSIEKIESRKNITLHMSRTDVKKNDGEERLAGRSLKGGVYNYESIDAGQYFEGLIVGDDDQLFNLCDKVGKAWECKIGRSKYTQYGNCTISLGEIEDVPKAEVKADKNNIVYLRLETPMLSWNGIVSRADDVLGQVAEYMNEVRATNKFHVKKDIAAEWEADIYSSIEAVDNFVGIWKMKRPRVTGVAAGTVFALYKADKWSDDDYKALNEMLYEGVGSRTEEGYGQLRVWIKNKYIISKKNDIVDNSDVVIKSREVKEVAKKILDEQLYQKVRMIAYQHAVAVENRPAQIAHLMSRLDAMVMNPNISSFVNFKMKIDELVEGNADRDINKNLHAMRLNGKALINILKEISIENMPYMNDLTNYIEESNLTNIYNVVGTSISITDYNICKEYWHWFFRHCRKIANANGGEINE